MTVRNQVVAQLNGDWSKDWSDINITYDQRHGKDAHGQQNKLTNDGVDVDVKVGANVRLVEDGDHVTSLHVTSLHFTWSRMIPFHVTPFNFTSFRLTPTQISQRTWVEMNQACIKHNIKIQSQYSGAEWKLAQDKSKRWLNHRRETKDHDEMAVK